MGRPKKVKDQGRLAPLGDKRDWALIQKEPGYWKGFWNTRNPKK